MKAWIGVALYAAFFVACSGNGSSTVDAGSGATTGAACGSVTEAGQCAGSLESYCADFSDGGSELQRIDCSTVLPAGETATCGTVDATFGVDCLAPVGGHCEFLDVTSQNPIFVACAGQAPGCIFTGDAGMFTCTENAGNCPLTTASSTAVCVGNLLVFDCHSAASDPDGYDCTSLGGTCANGGCNGLHTGAICDGDTTHVQSFNCGTGLTCPTNPDGGAQRCQ